MAFLVGYNFFFCFPFDLSWLVVVCTFQLTKKVINSHLFHVVVWMAFEMTMLFCYSYVNRRKFYIIFLFDQVTQRICFYMHIANLIRIVCVWKNDPLVVLVSAGGDGMCGVSFFHLNSTISTVMLQFRDGTL